MDRMNKMNTLMLSINQSIEKKEKNWKGKTNDIPRKTVSFSLANKNAITITNHESQSSKNSRRACVRRIEIESYLLTTIDRFMSNQQVPNK